MNGTLYGIGVGPGDPELLTLKAVRLIGECSVIAVPRSGSGDGELVALEIVRKAGIDLMGKELLELSMPMTKDKALMRQHHEEAEEALAKVLSSGKDVAFLTLGDPSVYSTYSYLHERLSKRGFTAKMVAGIPSFCAAAAALGTALAKAGEPIHIIPAVFCESEEYIHLKGTKVLMKSGRSLKKIKEAVRNSGKPQWAMMAERCTMEGERLCHSLEGIEDCAGYFSIVILMDEGE